jgi:flagellar basal body P-ring protein FlgI
MKRLFTALLLLTVLAVGGCGGPAAKAPSAETDLGATIGSLGEIFFVESIRVEGYGLVGGLRGTGSSECPPDVRRYLEQYIMKQLPKAGMDVGSFISSLDTAVVRVEGIMPAAVGGRKPRFDVRVTALEGTQTTSLEGGWLYGTELKPAGSFGLAMKTLAKAEGAVYIDMIDAPATDTRSGYVLGGGTVLDEYKINIGLRRPDYRMAALIRDRLNARFGSDTAKAVSPGQIELKVPPEYWQQPQRYIAVVRSMYLAQSPELTEQRISNFVEQLTTSTDKYPGEVSLEAIGNACIGKLTSLLESSNEEIRLRSARCMLNLGSDAGLDALRRIASDKNSTYRIEALEAITAAAQRADAAAIARNLLRDEDFNIRLAAYEQLRKLDDIAVIQETVGRSFHLEQIAQTPYKSIFVSRSGEPRIVLFGVPIYCRDNIFVESADGSITLNAPSGQQYVSVMRKHPRRPNLPPIQLRSSFELGDIIRTLCEEPVKKSNHGQVGLGVSYAEVIALLKQMCDQGVVSAEFHAGPLPPSSLGTGETSPKAGAKSQ